MKNFLNKVMTSAIFVAGITAAPALKAADNPPVSDVLGEARAGSSKISADWKSFSQQPKLSWTSDSAETTRIREDVKAAMVARQKLDACRSQASPAQIVSIDQVIDVIEEVAGDSTKSIEFLSINVAKLNDKQYKAYLVASSDSAARLAVLVAQLADHESHLEKFEAARKMLLASK